MGFKIREFGFRSAWTLSIQLNMQILDIVISKMKYRKT